MAQHQCTSTEQSFYWLPALATTALHSQLTHRQTHKQHTEATQKVQIQYTNTLNSLTNTVHQYVSYITTQMWKVTTSYSSLIHNGLRKCMYSTPWERPQWRPDDAFDRSSYLGVAHPLTTPPRIFSQFWHFVTSSGATMMPTEHTQRIYVTAQYLPFIHTYTHTYSAVSICSLTQCCLEVHVLQQ